MKIVIPGIGELDGDGPIVILGPNGSGKTQLATRIARNNPVAAISAQRRTWVDDSLPVLQEQQLKQNIQNSQNNWYNHSWQPTEEINFALSTLIQGHTSELTKRNEEAIEAGTALEPIVGTNLMLLQELWKKLFPKRKLEIGGFFPKVTRLDIPDAPTYHLRAMSDGERTILYMAARLLTAEQKLILVDEPELHMHSLLSVSFWNEAEKLRLDCRFIYVTHDLNFALSRRNSTCLIARSGDEAEAILLDQLPTSIAADVLGAATLPFYAKRIVFYEGETGKGFASEFFSAWFDDDETFAIPAGDRDSVCASTSGLRKVGVVAAEILGLIDRDFYPGTILRSLPEGVQVLSVHEIESVLCDRDVVAAIAAHHGRETDATWTSFISEVRKTFRDQTLNAVVAQRVRSRIGDLLNGAFTSSQIVPDLKQTTRNHAESLSALGLPGKVTALFDEEFHQVQSALGEGGTQLIATLPGKHLLSLLTKVLGFKDSNELTGLVVRSLNRRQLKKDDPLFALGSKIEAALLAYLPSRTSGPATALEAQHV